MIDIDYSNAGPFDAGADDSAGGLLADLLLRNRRRPPGATPPFLPARNAPRAFPATAPATSAGPSAPAYGPLTQQEAARPEAGTLQRLRYEYEHPVEPTQPHGLKAFGEGLLNVVLPRAEQFIQERRYAPAFAQQNRIAGLEKEAQLLAPQQQPLQDVTKKYSDALATGNQAEIDRLEPLVRRLEATTQKPKPESASDKFERIEGGQAIFVRPDGTAYAKPIEGYQAGSPKPTGRFVSGQGHEIQVYSDGSTKDLGAAQPHAAGRGAAGGKGGPRTEGVTPGMKAGDWLKRMGF